MFTILVGKAEATWSICLADSRTKEVAVGTVTCLETFDLMAIVPVVVVGKGSGACQASGDFSGARRPVIFSGLQAGTDPSQIMTQLAAIPGHASRQYGIADTVGRTTTFTGNLANQWAGGVTGTAGTIAYAIQGNILAGSCVVPAIENAIINTPGDIPAKLMAGMQAAKAGGGDGRCSCSVSMPTSCGCPPVAFAKSGHIGGIAVARTGDTDDVVCDAGGCADGDYFLRFSVAFQDFLDPDPVDQLQTQFNTWRSALNGRPDAIASAADVEPDTIGPYARGSAMLTFNLLDWNSAPITATIQSVSVVHAPGSAGITSIGPVVDLGGGQYSVLLTAGSGFGQDRFRITVDDGIRPVSLMPDPSLGVPAPPAPASSALGLSAILIAFVLAGVGLFARRTAAAY